MARWGQIGDFVGAISQTLVAIAAISAAVFFTSLYQAQSAAVREAVKLSEMMYDRAFYVAIVAPSWEICFKWLYWEGEEGKAYRRAVLSGDFISFRSEYKFTRMEDANNGHFGNLIRFPHHFSPYDLPAKGKTKASSGQLVHELSEHQVLVTWLQFWKHVHFLIEEGMVERDAVKTLLKDWYQNWHPFMHQLRRVAEMIVDATESDPPTISKDHARHRRIIDAIAGLEDEFELAPREGDEQRADEIFADVLEHYRKAHGIDADRRSTVASAVKDEGQSR